MALSPLEGDWCRVTRCSRSHHAPPDRPPALRRVALSGSQPAIYGSSQSGQPHFHIARHNIACNARPPYLPPSLLPSIIRSLARSFVCCLLSVASVLAAGRGWRSVRSCYRTARKPLKKEGASASASRGRRSKVLHNNTAACYTSFFTLRREGRRRRADAVDADLPTTRARFGRVPPKGAEGGERGRTRKGDGMSRLRRRLKARSYICMKQPCPAVTQ